MSYRRRPASLRIAVSLTFVAACVVGLGVAPGCGGSQKAPTVKPPTDNLGLNPDNPAAPPTPIDVDQNLCSPSGKRVVKYDINRDNRPDVWEYYQTDVDPATGEKTERLSCKMVDLNFDGKVDMTTFFNKRNERLLEMLDLDFDGKPDEWVYYDHDVKVRTALDTDFDGRPDTWRLYDPKKTGTDQERLVRVERATRDPNKVDYWEYWDGGQLQRIGYDTTGDGTIDRWETAANLNGGGSGGAASAPASESAAAPPPAAKKK